MKNKSFPKMNDIYTHMSLYLIEPYNPYVKNPKKKHWMEIAEEEAMYNRILAELKNQSLPSDAPNVSSATAAGPSAAGGGGVPEVQYFRPGFTSIGFTSSIVTADAPMAVSFTNLSTGIRKYETFLWNFGNGTTSVMADSSVTYNNTGSYSVYLTGSSTGDPTLATSSINYISASTPIMSASLSYITSSGPGPITATFTNLSVNSSQIPTSTYNMIFGDLTSASYSTASTFTHFYANTGSFTASLRATGSYPNLTSESVKMFYVPAPTLISRFTMSLNGTAAGSTATFVNTLNNSKGTYYDGNGGGANLTYLWNLGSASLSTVTTQIPSPQIYTAAGTYTVGLQVTESLYNIMSYSASTFELI